MPDFDTATVNGRRALVKHVLHENYLEGNVPDAEYTKLLDKFVVGELTIQEVTKILLKKPQNECS